MTRIELDRFESGSTKDAMGESGFSDSRGAEKKDCRLLPFGEPAANGGFYGWMK